jgi:CubicO group peptidase (beta-lactamase class C family)
MKRFLVACAIALLAPGIGVASDARDALDAQLEKIGRTARDSRTDALLILRDGEVLLERHADGDRSPIELMSATKSVVALGIGLLIADGHLESIDTPVHRFYPEWAQGLKRDITVRMLLDHTSGLQNHPNAGAEIEPAPDAVQLALAADLDAIPGEKFVYNNKATNLLSGVIAKASGEPMDAYLKRRLFDPLGIEPGPWHRDPAGNPWGMAGLPLTATDAARLGQLLLDDGVAPDGTRLLPQGFAAALFAPSARSEQVGLLWWRAPAWETYEWLPDASERLLAKSVPANVVDALQVLAVRRFDSRDAMLEAVATALGPDWNEVFGREIRQRGFVLGDLFDNGRGPVVAYRADGYLGQYIVVVPEKRLVAVRQIRRRDDHRSPQDNYSTFSNDVIALAALL